MVEKIIFEKEFTRDYCLILEQIWEGAFDKDHFGNTNPHTPKNIYYINDGVMEVWENKAAIKWFVDQLYKKNQDDQSFFDSKMDEYDDLLARLKDIWSKDKTSSLDELKNFIELLVKGMDYFLIFYYTAMDDRNTDKILSRANRLRDEDDFFEAADDYIRNSIEAIYPQTKNCSNTLLIEELDRIPQTDILQSRYKNFVVDFSQSKEITKLENFLEKNKNYKFIFDEVIDNDKVMGQVAYKGQAKGKVRIIKRKNQVNEFKKGEILLSPMTTPDFVPAMKKAVAFVTDEGGIVCHAAIIARELKIPCVIGTKVATKVFKDGDMVEIDTDEGIVKKVK